MVTSGERLAGRQGSIEAFFQQHVARNPEVACLLENAKPASRMQTTGNFSYGTTRAFGPGFIRVGDANGFIDPIFSTGVHLAFVAAEEAADAILAARKQPGRRDQYFGTYDRAVKLRTRYVSWFIYNFDDAAFRELLLNPRDTFGVRKAIVSVLAGDLRQEWRMTWRIAIFKAIWRLTRLKTAVNGGENTIGH
jgi:flavin-dependent dehydrogenase